MDGGIRFLNEPTQPEDCADFLVRAAQGMAKRHAKQGHPFPSQNHTTRLLLTAALQSAGQSNDKEVIAALLADAEATCRWNHYAMYQSGVELARCLEDMAERVREQADHHFDESQGDAA